MLEGFGALEYEACVKALGHFAHAVLRTLHEEGHLGVLFAYEPAQVHACIRFFGRRIVSLVHYEAYVGNDTQQVPAILAVERHGRFIVGGEQQFGAGPLAEHLLGLVQGVLYALAVLLEHEPVDQG